MGLFDVVTKPFEAVVDAGSKVVKSAADGVKKVVDSAVDGAKAVKKAVDSGPGSVLLRLNPITAGPLLIADTAKAVHGIATGEKGASVWDIPALGFAKGVGEGVVDVVKGVGYLAETGVKSSPLRALVDPTGFVEQWKQNAATAEFLVKHPDEVVKAFINPIVEDAEAGRGYEAAGRGAFEVLSLAFGPKGIDKVVRGAGAAGQAARGADILSDAARAAKGADAASDAARAGDAASDAARAAEAARAAADAAGDAGRAGDAIADASKVVDEILGDGLRAEQRAFAQKVDLRHIFEGDATGGLHHVDAPGVHGNATVAAHGAPKPGRTWKADVTIGGETKSSTMFPMEWSRTDVVDALDDVFTHGVRAESSKVPGMLEITGKHRGIDVTVIYDPATDRIITGFPKRSGQAFS